MLCLCALVEGVDVCSEWSGVKWAMMSMVDTGIDGRGMKGCMLWMEWYFDDIDGCISFVIP